MKTSTTHFLPWSTSSFGCDTGISALELVTLGEHLGQCRSNNDRLFALQCAAQSMQGFIMARFVTTLVIGALLAGLITWVLY